MKLKESSERKSILNQVSGLVPSVIWKSLEKSVSEALRDQSQYPVRENVRFGILSGDVTLSLQLKDWVVEQIVDQIKDLSRDSRK